ncbi:MAG: hypothetical protein DIU69_01615 [Bacillota bacterium]|nr:MAG: hypothetical protein DIU69_01615 [Bacillota bacterium]
MKIKRFRAPDMRAALQQIRSEIGDDAVILATRRVREGGWRTVFGLFGRPLVEVTVAWDEGPRTARRAGSRRQAAVPAANGRPAGGGGPATAPSVNGLPAGDGPTVTGTMPRAGETGTSALPATAGSQRLDVTVGDQPLVPTIRPREGTGPQAPRRPGGGGSAGAGADGVPVAPDPPASPGGRQAPGGALPPGLRLAATPPLSGVVVAIGPTGAGKTTTLAKLAAHATLERGLRVALVAADTYRLAATAQLEAYAQVLGSELAVAYSAAEVAAYVERLRSQADLVLVDTAGRSYRLPEVVAEMARVVAAAAPDRVLLVLPAVLSPADAEDLARAVRGIGVTDLVVTKVDETVSPRALLERAATWGWPLALVGCGQRVPEDLVTATPEALSPWLDREARVAPVGGGGGRGGAG